MLKKIKRGKKKKLNKWKNSLNRCWVKTVIKAKENDANMMKNINLLCYDYDQKIAFIFSKLFFVSLNN